MYPDESVPALEEFDRAIRGAASKAFALAGPDIFADEIASERVLLPFKCKFKGGGLRPTAPFACAAFTGRVFAIADRLGAACGHGVGDRLFGPRS